jgi:hypothetical protein
LQRRTPHENARQRATATKSYEELVSALLADMGNQPVRLGDFPKAASSWQSLQEQVESRVGPSGFMWFMLIDHGALITKAGNKHGSPSYGMPIGQIDASAGTPCAQLSMGGIQRCRRIRRPDRPSPRTRTAGDAGSTQSPQPP